MQIIRTNPVHGHGNRNNYKQKPNPISPQTQRWCYTTKEPNTDSGSRPTTTSTHTPKAKDKQTTNEQNDTTRISFGIAECPSAETLGWLYLQGKPPYEINYSGNIMQGN